MFIEAQHPAVNCRLAGIFLLSVLLHGGLFLWQRQVHRPPAPLLALSVSLSPGAAQSGRAVKSVEVAERLGSPQPQRKEASSERRPARSAAPAAARPLATAEQVAAKVMPKDAAAAGRKVSVAQPAKTAAPTSALVPKAPDARGISAPGAALAQLQPQPVVAGTASSGASRAEDSGGHGASSATPQNSAQALALNAPANPDLLAAYRRQLGELFARHQAYPRLAALRGWEGEVRVRLKVARKGSLLAVQLDRSSGFDVLDRHALAMLGELPALPALPEGLASDELQLVVPILYKLNKTT